MKSKGSIMFSAKPERDRAIAQEFSERFPDLIHNLRKELHETRNNCIEQIFLKNQRIKSLIAERNAEREQRMSAERALQHALQHYSKNSCDQSEQEARDHFNKYHKSDGGLF